MLSEAVPQKVTLTDSEGNKHHAEVLIPDETHFASGTRSQVYKVLVRTDGPVVAGDASGDRPMAMKVYKSEENPANHARNTRRGRDILSLNLPDTEVSHIAEIFFDDQNRLFLPLLNEDSWVVSVGPNESVDRNELRQKKLDAIPNFNAVLEQLLDAVEAMGNKGIPMGSDVYFLRIHRKTGKMDYTYADMEAVSVGRESPEQTTLNNLYWAAGAFNHFLHECVKDPVPYLVRVRQEVISRMNAYSDIADARSMVQDVEAFEWPTLDWKQSLQTSASWFMVQLGRLVKGALQS